MPWTTPKTDWDTNPTNPLPSDFNRIEGNIEFLNTDIETKKGLIVDALNSVGIAALIADTHVQLASKITGAKKTGISITPGPANQEIPKGIYDTGGGIVLGDTDLISSNIKAGANIFGVIGSAPIPIGTAAAVQVLTGYTFSNNSGVGINGGMANRGAVAITPSTVNQAIAAGYHNGSGYVVGDPDLLAANIISGKAIFNVNGTAVEKKIATGKVTPPTDGYTFYYTNGGTNMLGRIAVTGLTFKPSIIFCWLVYNNYEYLVIYTENSYTGAFYPNTFKQAQFNSSSGSFSNKNFKADAGAASVLSNGFTAPSMINANEWTWVAIS